MIYTIRRHNEFEKIRDLNMGAFSSYEKVVEAIRSNLMESGYYEEAMKIELPPDYKNPFKMECGLEVDSIRFPFSSYEWGKFFEVRKMTLDGE